MKLVRREHRLWPQHARQSTEDMPTGTQLSEYTDLAVSDAGIPLAAIDGAESRFPVDARRRPREALVRGWGCPHVLETSDSYGHTKWRLDTTNTVNASIACNELDQGDLDDRIDMRRLVKTPACWLSNLRVLCGDRWYIDAHQLIIARELEIIRKLPDLPLDRLADLDNEDLFVKLLAVSQTTWLFVQLSMRLLRGIPTTQLEVMTMGYALCSATTYILLIRRPKGVQTVIEVEAVRYPTSKELGLIANVGPHVWGGYRSGISIPNNSIHYTGNDRFYVLPASLAMTIFGSLHFTAWNFEFPSRTEAILWRTSTILTVAALPAVRGCFAIIRAIDAMLQTNFLGERKEDILAHSAFLSFLMLFIAARYFIVLEVFYSLAYQPPGSYQSTWAAYIPHVG